MTGIFIHQNNENHSMIYLLDGNTQNPFRVHRTIMDDKSVKYSTAYSKFDCSNVNNKILLNQIWEDYINSNTDNKFNTYIINSQLYNKFIYQKFILQK